MHCKENSINETFIKNLPKVELHCHLDGSVPIATLEKLAIKDGLGQRDFSAAQAPEKCLNLADYLNCFDVILPLLQTAENLEMATYDVIESLVEENVKYAELRFAPLLHRHGGLSIKEVVEAVCAGVTRAQSDFAITVNLIISGMRHHTEVQNQALLTTIKELASPCLVACDAAGDEASYDNSVIASYISDAKAAGFQISLHSGECGCAHNVYEAIQLGASRIGHGVAIKDDPVILEFVATTGTVLELCPISNLQTNAIATWADYPLQEFLAKGVKCTINTDNRTVSQTSLTRELMTLAKECQLQPAQIEILSRYAIEATFTTLEKKAELDALLTDYLAKNSTDYSAESV